MRQIFIIILITCAFFRCSKEAAKPEPVLYVVGSDNFDAVYWKNGTEVIIPNSTPDIVAGFVSGTDVYLAGNTLTSKLPAIWKNNDMTLLAFTALQARVYGMFVSGTDVYAAGDQIDAVHNLPVYWKNGSLISLPFTVNSIALGIFIAGTDIYVVGYDGPDAVYWKNGVETLLPKKTPSSLAIANGVFVAGTDVYVVGTDNGAVLWKNGVETTLSVSAGSSYSNASCVFVTGSDVYVGGYQVITSTHATFWKNNVPTASTVANTEAYSIFVSGADVYLSGVQITPGTGQRSPIYWKNMVAVSPAAAGHYGTAAHIALR